MKRPVTPFAKKTYIAALILTFFLGCGTVLASAANPPLACKVVNLQGKVSYRRAGEPGWQPLRLHQEIFAGDAVQTGSASQAALLCLDESQIKLNEDTMVIFKRVAPSPRLRLGETAPASLEQVPGSLYAVSKGEIWLRNKNEKFRFQLETPAVNAGIRGTEFSIRVAGDGTTRVILLEGRLDLANAFGSLSLSAGEEGLAQPGQAPRKRVILQPADAVQWALYYPGILSYRDLPLAPPAPEKRTPPGTAASMGPGEEAYDRGNLAEAQQEAQRILAQEPDHGPALTLLGWIELQRRAPAAAQERFRKIRQADYRAVIGLALARYQLGDASGAYDLLETARQKLRPSPLLLTMSGYFALLVGRVEEARTQLEGALRQTPDLALARSLLAQIYLVQNRKDAAQAEASQALARSPNSPLALLTMGLVQIAAFKLPAAVNYLEKSLAADPRFVDAYIYLAKIWLGSEYLGRAQKTIDQALRLAAEDGVVLSLAGFIRLAHRDFAEARGLFERAVKANPGLGEPHLGLSICFFRDRDYDRGLEEMLAATLLEPRVSLYQSELGKALYHSRSFAKALEVYDYAKTLDPRDPTPYLYKGIALSDLNRPGEAVQEINQSIDLNDNTAVFRSRLMLDRDLAVRNYNLARAYNQLGLAEWAFSKAVTAVKNDPLNSSAHLFLSQSYGSYQGSGIMVSADDAERLIYRVTAPANQNTFSSIYNVDYTSMFEMPYWRVAVQGGVGAWKERRTIQDHAWQVYGGRPGLAFYDEGAYQDDQGFRERNANNKPFYNFVALKWEPTVHGCLLADFQYNDQKTGDLDNRNDSAYLNLPGYRATNRLRMGEAAYVHRFGPRAALLAYATCQRQDLHENLGRLYFEQGLGVTQNAVSAIGYNFSDFQVQQQLVLGKHTLIGGVDHFSGTLNYYLRNSFYWRTQGQPFFETDYAKFRPPERTTTFYLLDYWRVHPKLLVELGLFKDFAKNARYGFGHPVSNSMWNPQLGINYQVNTRHTLRLALQRHLNTHFLLQPLLAPTEVAGFTWLTDSSHGSIVKEAGLSWEAQWNARTFSVLRLHAQRIDTPNFDDYLDRNWAGWKKYQATLAFNRILLPSLGLAGGVTGKRVTLDQSLQQVYPNYYEVYPYLGLYYLHRDGWLGNIRVFGVYQSLTNRSDNLYGLVNLRLGKELAKKRGLVTLDIDNLFNRHFYYAMEPLRDPEFFPARRIVFRLALYF